MRPQLPGTLWLRQRGEGQPALARTRSHLLMTMTLANSTDSASTVAMLRWSPSGTLRVCGAFYECCVVVMRAGACRGGSRACSRPHAGCVEACMPVRARARTRRWCAPRRAPVRHFLNGPQITEERARIHDRHARADARHPCERPPAAAAAAAPHAARGLALGQLAAGARPRRAAAATARPALRGRRGRRGRAPRAPRAALCIAARGRAAPAAGARAAAGPGALGACAGCCCC